MIYGDTGKKETVDTREVCYWITRMAQVVTPVTEIARALLGSGRVCSKTTPNASWWKSAAAGLWAVVVKGGELLEREEHRTIIPP
jgi:hypothetical protein